MRTEQPYIGSPDNPRTPAVVSYITFIGWLIARFALYKGSKTPFTAFHLRQSLLIHIISFLLNVAYSFIIYNTGMLSFYLIAMVVLGLFLHWLIGLIDALNGRENPVPFIGSAAQNIFGSL